MNLYLSKRSKEILAYCKIAWIAADFKQLLLGSLMPCLFVCLNPATLRACLHDSTLINK